MIRLTGNAYPHRYCIPSRVLHIVYTGRESIDYFDLVWTKNPQIQENVLKMEAILSQNSPPPPPNRNLEIFITERNGDKRSPCLIVLCKLK